MRYLFILLLASCVDLPTPECEDILIEKRGDLYVAWWLPELDPIHSGAIVSVDGIGVKSMCKRDSNLRMSKKGTLSFYVEVGSWICVDYDHIVTDDDYECCSLVK